MNRIVAIALKAFVTTALLYLALRGLDFASFKTKLLRMDPVWAIAALLACMGQLCCGALRWKSIIEACGARIGLITAFRLLLVGTFFSQTLPSTVGGDGVRLLLLQRLGATWRTATYSVFIDRAIGVIVLALMVVLGLPWAFRLIADENARTAMVALAGVALSGGMSFLLFGFVPARFSSRWFPVRHLHSLAETSLGLISSKGGTKVVLASITGHLFGVAIAWCIGKAVAVPLSFGETYLLILPVTLISAVPISIAGWGVREQALQFAFLSAGLNGNDGVLVSLLFGITYLIIGASGGVIWLFTSGRRELSPSVGTEADRIRSS